MSLSENGVSLRRDGNGGTRTVLSVDREKIEGSIKRQVSLTKGVSSITVP